MPELKDAPPLTRIERHFCMDCESYLDPREIVDVPHHGRAGQFRRLVLMRCPACKALWVVLLQYAPGSTAWAYVAPPQKLPDGQELRADLALEMHESPTVRDALRKNHLALYNRVIRLYAAAADRAGTDGTGRRRS